MDNMYLMFFVLCFSQPVTELAMAAVLVPQQALDSLIPKPPDKKDNKNQEPPKELGILSVNG